MNEEEKLTEQEEEQSKKMDQIIAKAWADEEFKQRLISDPVAVLKEAGVEVPEGIKMQVVEDTDAVVHLVLPPKPSSDELSEEELSQAAGGHCRRCGYYGCGYRCSCGCNRCSYGCYRCRRCC